MATLTNISKHPATLTGKQKHVGDAIVFYGWLFLFTIPQYRESLTGQTKHTAALINQSKH